MNKRELRKKLDLGIFPDKLYLFYSNQARDINKHVESGWHVNYILTRPWIQTNLLNQIASIVEIS